MTTLTRVIAILDAWKADGWRAGQAVRRFRHYFGRVTVSDARDRQTGQELARSERRRARHAARWRTSWGLAGPAVSRIFRIVRGEARSPARAARRVWRWDRQKTPMYGRSQPLRRRRVVK